MDAAQVAAYEDRAVEAERRLAALEARLSTGGAGSAAVNTDRYIAELGSLRGILEAALAEQQALEKRMAQVESENSKLRYQAVHLKRAVKEADEKLASKN